jgi:hypothetical protein
VLHLAGSPTVMRDVAAHLFEHARERGVLALSGRVEPAIMSALSDGYALLHRRGPTTLVHAKRPELMSAFETGEAFFSRLAGEYGLRFTPPRH